MNDRKLSNGLLQIGLILLITCPGSIAKQYDFDGDGYADHALKNVSLAQQEILYSSEFQLHLNENIARSFLLGEFREDIPVSGDFDGDGIWDIGVRHPSTYNWQLRHSSNNTLYSIQFGLHEEDIPVIADYDGDGISDLAVRRPSTQFWYIKNSSGVDHITGHSDGITRLRFGLQEQDIPITGDFDGDGKADIAVRRASNFTWYIRNSSGSNFNSERMDGIQRVVFGRHINDIPVPADYTGDGITDIAVRRPSTFTWYIKNSNNSNYNSEQRDGIQRIVFGRNIDDIPVVADYDGDNLADVAVFRPSNQTFYVQNSSKSNFNSLKNDGIQRISFSEGNTNLPLAAEPLHIMTLIEEINNNENSGVDIIAALPQVVNYSKTIILLPEETEVQISIDIIFDVGIADGEISIEESNGNVWYGVFQGSFAQENLIMIFHFLTYEDSNGEGETVLGSGEILGNFPGGTSTLNLSLLLSANQGAHQFTGDFTVARD